MLTLKTISDLEGNQLALVKQQQTHLDPEKLKTLSKVKTELNVLNIKRAEFLVHRARQSNYFDGSSSSFL